MINEVLNYIDKLVSMIQPKMVYIAIDGVAPCSKMLQQRLRRYKSILERKEQNALKERFNVPYNKDFWDTNAISPGTQFMDFLAKCIDSHIQKSDIYKPLDVIFSNYSIHGEGEHKIFDLIKKTDIQGNNVIYGLP